MNNRAIRTALGVVRAVWSRVSGSRRLSAHAAVLPVLRRQLEEASQSVEESVTTVCRNFQGMVARARQAVEDATRILTGDGQKGLEPLIDTSRVTLEKLLGRIERSSESSLDAARQIEDVDAAMKKIHQASLDIEKIAFTNRILALNAKIQAVHVGDAGAGFSVVADEISDQAGKSTDLAAAIEQNVTVLSRAISSVAQDLRSMAEEERELREGSRREIEALIQGFTRAHAETKDWADRTAKANSDLAREIAGAVVALQFQDRVGQRIAHVIDSLAEIERAISSAEAGAPASNAQALARMEETYTMESERAALAAVAQRTGTQSQSGSEDGEVELF